MPFLNTGILEILVSSKNTRICTLKLMIIKLLFQKSTVKNTQRNYDKSFGPNKIFISMAKIVHIRTIW